MALNLRALTLYASTPHTADVGSVNWYKYGTADVAATVLAAGYFNNARDKLRVNDCIEVLSAAAGTGDRLDVIVTAVPASGNVTVAVNTSASGA